MTTIFHFVANKVIFRAHSVRCKAQSMQGPVTVKVNNEKPNSERNADTDDGHKHGDAKKGHKAQKGTETKRGSHDKSCPNKILSSGLQSDLLGVAAAASHLVLVLVLLLVKKRVDNGG